MSNKYKKRDETPIRKPINVKKNVCQHKRTVAINEEGYAGIFCSGCGKQLKREC